MNVSNNLGAGIAPWNISRYRICCINPLKIWDKYTKTESEVVFIHYSGVDFINERMIKTHVKDKNWVIDECLVNYTYHNYFYKLIYIRSILKSKYNIELPYYNATSQGIERNSMRGRIKNKSWIDILGILHHRLIKCIKRRKSLYNI